jgi:hypothetical protein
VRYMPDYDTLRALLGVPLLLDAPSQSGVPALALDVWTSFELRRCGFSPDAVWPRAAVPRVLPSEVQALVEQLPKQLRQEVVARMARGGKGMGTASANILGKNYVKQVDVGISAWNTGPELLISTKRMDSSFGKNAANRVEESYGDAKNLRLRYPQAGLGFLYGLRSTALSDEPDRAAWLIDLLTKLGREDDAYHAVALIIPDWGGPEPEGSTPEQDEDDEDPLSAAGFDTVLAEVDEILDVPADKIAQQLNDLPNVILRTEEVPAELDPARFFQLLVARILDNSPINFHVDARRRLRAATGVAGSR